MHRCLGDFLTELVENAVEAGAQSVSVELKNEAGCLEMCVQDNGPGMDSDTLRRVFDPFFTDGRKHQTRKAGLGLSFLRQTLDQIGGTLRLESELGQGTQVWARFPLSHWDTPPEGDWVETLAPLFSKTEEFDLKLTRSTDSTGKTLGYTVSRKDLQEALGDLQDSSAFALLKTYIRSLEEEIRTGV